jgi:hypothetical protein
MAATFRSTLPAHVRLALSGGPFSLPSKNSKSLADVEPVGMWAKRQLSPERAAQPRRGITGAVPRSGIVHISTGFANA